MSIVSYYRRLLKTEEARAATRCLASLATVVSIGTIGFLLIEEDWTVWKSLFFTLITITTVGYGDQGVSPRGEVFAAFLLVFGIGAATYSISSLFQLVVSYPSTRKRKMQEKINRLKQHYVVCGFGRIGRTVCEQLRDARLPVVVVDSCEAKIEAAGECEYLTVAGDATDDQTLRRAGVDRARGIVCVLNSDSENVFVTLSVRELNPQAYIVARSGAECAGRRMERAGASLVVSPYTTAGLNIADAILRPKLAEFLSNTRQSGNSFELGELKIADTSPLAEQTLRDVGQWFPSIAFVALQRVGQAIIVRPAGDTRFRVGDRVTIAGNPEDLESIYERSQRCDSALSA